MEGIRLNKLSRVCLLAMLLVSAQRLIFIATAQQAVAVKESTTGRVSAEAVQRHINFLASDELKGRRAGTPEADKAADYIANEFRRYGLKPLKGDNYLQPF